MKSSDSSSLPPSYTASPKLSKLNPTIRSATQEDAPAIAALHTYYAQGNTSMRIASRQISANIERTLNVLQKDYGCPCLVATVSLAQLSAQEKAETEKKLGYGSSWSVEDLFLTKKEHQDRERVVGYGTIQAHRSSSTSTDGYWRVAEMYLWVAPRHTRRGVGTALAKEIMAKMRLSGWVPPQARIQGWNAPSGKAREAAEKASLKRWTQLLAIMTIGGQNSGNEGNNGACGSFAKDEVHSLKQFWESLGFREVGRFREVFEADGKAWDELYFQRSAP